MDEPIKWPGSIIIDRAEKAGTSSVPLGSGSLTTVPSIGDALEHVHATGAIKVESLREMNRLLELGEFFICCHLPNRLSMIEAVGRLVPGKHCHRYPVNRKEIKTLYTDSSFSLEPASLYEIFPRNIFPGPLSSLGNFRPLCFYLNKLERSCRFHCGLIARILHSLLAKLRSFPLAIAIAKS